MAQAGAPNLGGRTTRQMAVTPAPTAVVPLVPLVSPGPTPTVGVGVTTPAPTAVVSLVSLQTPGPTPHVTFPPTVDTVPTPSPTVVSGAGPCQRHWGPSSHCSRAGGCLGAGRDNWPTHARSYALPNALPFAGPDVQPHELPDAVPDGPDREPHALPDLSPHHGETPAHT
jgi:hypothetical protein